MRVSLSDDQEFFRETTAKFLTQFASPDEVRRLQGTAAGFEPDYWRRGAELGWTSLLVGEDHGGGSISGEGLVDLTLVAHEFGRHAAPGPLIPTNVVAAALSRGGDAGHGELLERLLAGSGIAAWACSEPSAAHPAALPVDVSPDGTHVVLRGSVRPVESAAEASHLLVTGRTGDGLTQVVVPTDSAGVSVRPLKSLDLTRRFAEVQFDDVRVPRSEVLGDVGCAAADVEWQRQRALVVVVAEAVGTMERAFRMTVEWSFDRYSFGRPLASYQELKHRFADMLTWLEASHAVVDAAAVAVQSGSDDAAQLVSAAKAFVGDRGTELIQDCVQIHGGIGLTFEHDLHLYLRRHSVDRVLFGTPADHRQRLTSIVSGAVEPVT